MNTLTIVRGLPGSGKTTLAKNLTKDNGVYFESDMFFSQDGTYVFDAYKLKDAHAWCKAAIYEAIALDVENVVASNYIYADVGNATICRYG